MDKKIILNLSLVILKLKNTNLTTTKNPVLIDVDINEIIILNKISLGKKGFKYFIGYKYDLLSKMGGYTKCFSKLNLCSSFLIKDDELMECQMKVCTAFAYQ